MAGQRPSRIDASGGMQWEEVPDTIFQFAGLGYGSPS